MLCVLENYLQNPCAVLSIPYWKAKNITIPDYMKIVHERDYSAEWLEEYEDEPYFRIYHAMKNVKKPELTDYKIVTALPEDLETIVALINRSYDDLQVRTEQMQSYTKTPVYCPDLWILVKESATGKCVGCGIADFDPEAEELILEWIQVLPEYRRRGVGRIMVTELLRRMVGKADFATVSGRCNSKSKPEKLYHACGFRGNDIWYIMHKK